MATNVAIIDADQPSVTTAVNQYTSPANGAGTRIVAFTASLVTGTETYRVFVGTSAATATEIVPAESITGPNRDTPLELINHLIPAGSSLFTQVSTGPTITFRASGIEF